MKKSNELKYDITAGYLAEYDETWHFLKFKDNGETFQIPNIIVDYGVKLLKLFPNYEIPTYVDSKYDPKSNRIYMFLKSKGNPYGLKNKKDVKINLNNIKENHKMKNEKRLLNDMERAYVMTLSDIARYKRQAGTISIDVVKKFICFNYFKNTNVTKIWTYEDDGVKNFIMAIDMFDLQLWLVENYGVDYDIIENIEDELRFLTTFYITK